ncbi:MAG: YidC/Oxa1 family membrane protein insertase [Syntrophomonas sp.]
MWQSFVQWFASIIQFLYGLTGSIGLPNYGLAIIIMTILIKLVLFPITHKQLKSMRAMQEIQPRMKYLQEKYKEDPQTMQAKLMELYKEHGVNPLSGCLPLLIQMPIFIAFYQSLYKFEFKVAAHAEFLWIPNIGSPDPYYFLAVLAALTTYLQQRVSMVDTKDPTQKSMLYVMPLFMAWIAATMPAGLPLYWVTFNILGILQQLYINRTTGRAKLDTGTGIQFETQIEGKKVESDSIENSAEEKVAGRDKGGKNNNGSPNNRKKRKKR